MLLLTLACGLSTVLWAQPGKRILNRAKNSAEHKVNSKVDQAVDKTVDKGVNELDTLLSGKKSKTPASEPPKPPAPPPSTGTPTNNTSPAVGPAPDTGAVQSLPGPNTYARQMNTAWVSDLIFTNITCEKGKRTVEKKLGSLKGVRSAQVNVTNGELAISYFPAEVSYNRIIEVIQECFFEADGRPVPAGKNGCQ